MINERKKAAISSGLPMHDIMTHMIAKIDPTSRITKLPVKNKERENSSIVLMNNKYNLEPFI